MTCGRKLKYATPWLADMVQSFRADANKVEKCLERDLRILKDNVDKKPPDPDTPELVDRILLTYQIGIAALLQQGEPTMQIASTFTWARRLLRTTLPSIAPRLSIPFSLPELRIPETELSHKNVQWILENIAISEAPQETPLLKAAFDGDLQISDLLNEPGVGTKGRADELHKRIE